MTIDETTSTELLKIPWEKWTPEHAELVRRHFLGRWVHKAQCADLTLLESMGFMSPVATWGPETQKLREAAALYCNSPYIPHECFTVNNPFYPGGCPYRS